ncbi:MAG: VWA domain-containing protein, partial [Bryobacteraceae bacterium]
LVVSLTAVAGLVPAADQARDENARVSVTPRAARPLRTGTPAAMRVDVGLILIPVTVTDTFGAPYSGLPRESFRLYEDGIEQNVKYFSVEDAPISMGVVFDASQSMSGRLDQSRQAVARFLTTAAPGDEYFLVEFNDAPRLLSKFTSDTDLLHQKLMGIRPKNWTALYDAVYLSIHQSRLAKNARKALLVLSDGGDNYSRYTEGEMKNLIREGDVVIYAIALSSGGLIKRHVRLMKQLAEETGGLCYEVDKLGELPTAVEKISAAIHNQYVLGYSPDDLPNEGAFRKIEVKLNPGADQPARLRASWRNGYYAHTGR